MDKSQHQEIADILWERLVAAFNDEAKHYKTLYAENGYGESRLGSIGPVEDREVCRPDWWRELGGEALIESVEHLKIDRFLGKVSHTKAWMIIGQSLI
ncbi:hypothetical protein [Lactococcus fujiensis]|uniref:hypothetical protein n=1 Tax=Lactococcus fujiensis TaxID=610251 RepID=UPI0006D25AA6|nr:hypothetical protein [Lactococcus fujiensis]